MATHTCGYCSLRTHMTMFGNAVQVGHDEVDPFQPWLMQAVFSCDNCKRLSTSSVWLQDPVSLNGDAAAWNTGDWSPIGVARREFVDVPEPIRSVAREVDACYSIGAYRAAVLLARGVIEATAKDKDITEGNLATKISELARQHFIRQGVADAAHELRYLGNDAAHGDFSEDTDEPETAAAMDIMTQVLQEVYQSPAQTARLAARRRSAANT